MWHNPNRIRAAQEPTRRAGRTPTHAPSGSRRPSAAVAEDAPKTDLFSALTDLQQAANEIFAAFPRQVLPFDLAAAGAYADVVAVRERLAHPIDGFDAQIAAICRAQTATLATRNTKAFADTGIGVVDLWHDATT